MYCKIVGYSPIHSKGSAILHCLIDDKTPNHFGSYAFTCYASEKTVASLGGYLNLIGLNCGYRVYAEANKIKYAICV